MSAIEVRAPAEQTEGTRSQILRWLKSVGEPVSENEPLIEIETDKVTVEVASPGSGTLLEILKQEQEQIGPGDLLGRIGPAAGSSAAATQLGEATGAVVPAASRASAVGAEASPDASFPARSGDGQSASRPLSPAVRRLLAERGLEASSIEGTGPGGRLTVDDVLHHAAGGAAGGSVPGSGSLPTHSAMPADSTADRAPEVAGPSRRIPHTAVRKRIAEHMVQSLLHTAPHVTTVFEADLTAVLEHRLRAKDDFARRGAPLTLTAYFLQASVAAIRAVPEANSRWTDSALEVFESMHIGVATALETGLVVPVLRDVQSRDLFEIARGLEDLVMRAREGGLSPSDLRGGTFTISNHGVSGSLVAAPIVINQPQSAILGIGKLEKRAVVLAGDGNEDDRIAIQPRCYVTLTIDHRVMDGHRANRFLQAFVKCLATPAL